MPVRQKVQCLQPLSAQFFDELARSSRQFFREFDIDADKKVSSGTAAVGYAFPAHAQHFPVIDAGRHGEHFFAVERPDAIFSSEKSVGQFYRKRCQKIVPFARKLFVRPDVKLHIQISGGSARDRFSHAGHAYHFAVGNSRGDIHAYLLFALQDAFTPAGLAWSFRHLSASTASRAHAR